MPLRRGQGARGRKNRKPQTDMDTTALTSAIADLINRSSVGDRIYDCGAAVTVNTEDGSIDCSSIYEGSGRILLTADAIIAYVGGTDDAEAWAAANPEEAAAQYVTTFYGDLDQAYDRLMAEA